MLTISGSTARRRSSGSGGGLTYNGTVTLTMNTAASNSFTGNFAINSGIVFVASDARLGGTANTVIINGGTLEDNGATLVATRTIALGPSSGTGSGTISTRRRGRPRFPAPSSIMGRAPARCISTSTAPRPAPPWR